MEPSSNPDGAQPFKVDLDKPLSLAEMFFGAGAKIVHPCDAFAERAGFASWAAALTAMKSGQIVTATAPRIGRTTMDYDIFVKQARKNGLIMIWPPHDECGFVSVGLRGSFPAGTLERIEREAALAALNPFQPK
jgi:hypothetical protein